MLQKAKVELYRLLLEVDYDNLTDIEVDLMYLLCKDRQVQEYLSKVIRNERSS